MSGISLAVTAYCIANPKACFGSCPTFYLEDEGGREPERPQAEGFSESIARVLEARDIDALLALMEEHSAGKIVVGLPVNMDGSIGARGKDTLKFVDYLRTKTPVDVVTWDERLSTVAVTRVLIEGDVSRGRRKEVVDKMAAAYILQGYLDSQKPS